MVDRETAVEEHEEGGGGGGGKGGGVKGQVLTTAAGDGRVGGSVTKGRSLWKRRKKGATPSRWNCVNKH